MSQAISQPIELTGQQQQHYQQDGYFVVEELVTPAFAAALQRRVRDYTHGGRNREGLAMQLEPRVSRGELQVAHPGDGIRKISNLVEYDALFRQLALAPAIVSVMQQLLGPDVMMFRNALLVKPPAVGSQKGMHQDSPYWPIEPMSLCSCWYAIDDATPENGCMGVLPGGHKLGALPHVSVTDDYVVEPANYSADDMVLAPVPAGGGLFFHSLLPHYTAPNTSSTWRRAIALSYMSARSRTTRERPADQFMPVSGHTFEGCVQAKAIPTLTALQNEDG